MEEIEVKKANGYIVGVPKGTEAYYIEKVAEKVPFTGEVKERLVIKPLLEIPEKEKAELERIVKILPKGVKPPEVIPEFEEEEIPPEKREEFRQTLFDLLKYYHIPEKVEEGMKKLAEVAGVSLRRLVGWLRKIGVEKKGTEEIL